MTKEDELDLIPFPYDKSKKIDRTFANDILLPFLRTAATKVPGPFNGDVSAKHFRTVYRTRAEQQINFDNYKTKGGHYAVSPDVSRHVLGKAVDFNFDGFDEIDKNEWFGLPNDIKQKILNDEIVKTGTTASLNDLKWLKIHHWIKLHGAKFGLKNNYSTKFSSKERDLPHFSDTGT